jgi:hypothetical protein
MKRSFLALTALLGITTSSTASASYLERCELEVEVKTAQKLAVLNQTVSGGGPHVVLVEVIAAENLGSHNPAACSSKVGKLQPIQVEPSDLSLLPVGSQQKFLYRFVSGMTPDGIRSNRTWRLVNED